MATTITAIHIQNRNTGYEATVGTGVSSVPGVPEDFKVTLPSADEKAMLVLQNTGSTNSVTVKFLASSSWKGKVPDTVTVAAGKTFVFSFDSAVVKGSAGVITLRVSPPTGVSVSSCGINMFAAYQGVTAL